MQDKSFWLTRTTAGYQIALGGFNHLRIYAATNNDCHFGANKDILKLSLDACEKIAPNLNVTDPGVKVTVKHDANNMYYPTAVVLVNGELHAV